MTEEEHKEMEEKKAEQLMEFIDELRSVQGSSLNKEEPVVVDVEELLLPVCPLCGAHVRALTKDHIIPKWLYNPSRLKNLGVIGYKTKKYQWEKEWTGNIQHICSQCNNKKGGSIDFKHPKSRRFVKNLITVLQEQLDDAAPKEIVLHVKCTCHD